MPEKPPTPSEKTCECCGHYLPDHRDDCDVTILADMIRISIRDRSWSGKHADRWAAVKRMLSVLVLRMGQGSPHAADVIEDARAVVAAELELRRSYNPGGINQALPELERVRSHRIDRLGLALVMYDGGCEGCGKTHPSPEHRTEQPSPDALETHRLKCRVIELEAVLGEASRWFGGGETEGEHEGDRIRRRMRSTLEKCSRPSESSEACPAHGYGACTSDAPAPPALYAACEGLAVVGNVAGWLCTLCREQVPGDPARYGHAPKPFPHRESCVLHRAPEPRTANVSASRPGNDGPGAWHGDGWHRIGRFDKVRRRSTWARILYNGDPATDGGEPVSIELIGGREGDDAKVIVRPDNPAFGALGEVIEYAIANLPEDDDEEHVAEPKRSRKP